MINPNGRNVVILGCSRGIGLGVLDHLASSEKCTSVVGVVRKEMDLKKLKTKYSNVGKVHILQGDVSDLDSMKEVVEEVRLIGIVPDLLLCNAGVLTEPKPFDHISRADMQDSFEVNVLGPHFAMTAFMPLMRNVKGAVMVNVSSGWGLWGEAGQASYCATKHALEGLVKCAALDVANDPLAIVSVRPGVVNTDMLGVALGSKEAAQERGVSVSTFAVQFCDKIMALTKAQSGTHVDCGYKGV
jgi:NAD(P)-dependent dehydrogenase (short-subunit alcohol dehydrogenase family)